MVKSQMTLWDFSQYSMQSQLKCADTSCMNMAKCGLLLLILAIMVSVPRVGAAGRGAAGRGAAGRGAAGQGAAQTFLTYEQFSDLNPSQQLAYIEAVRKLVLNLARSPSLSAKIEAEGLFLQKMDFVSRTLPAAWAQSQVTLRCRVTSAREFDNEDLLSRMQQVQNCREVVAIGNHPYLKSFMPHTAAVLAEEYSRRIEEGRLNPRSYGVQESIGGLESALKEMRSKGVMGGGNHKESLDRAEAALQRAIARFGTSPSALPSRSSRVNGSSNSPQGNERGKSTGSSSSTNSKAGPIARNSNLGASSSKATGEALSDQNRSASAGTPTQSTPLPSQCLYGGFVIDQKAMKGCNPLSRLPNYFESGFFDKDQFQCGGSVPVLCNPLLFGYLPQCDEGENPPCYKKKPLCTPRSAKATADCYNQAKERNTLRFTEDVWKGPEGQKMYESFIGSLKSLCDSENLEKRNLKPKSKLDIEQTCEVAFQAFNELVENKFLPQDLHEKNKRIETSPSSPKTQQ